MHNRREVVMGGALSLLFSCGAPIVGVAQAMRVREGHGCMLSDDEAQQFMDDNTDTRLFATGNEPMIPRSGNRDFDLALAITLAKVSKTFDVLPGFAYYDDYDGQNAYATSRVRLKNADGTVLFGQGLLRRLMNSPESPEVAVTAVCAHEFGHILQYKRKLDRVVGAAQKTVKRIELQADFFAGYFAGVRKLERPEFPAAVFAVTQHGAGDNMVNHPNHHGTPDERAAAITKGFEVAYRERRSLIDAISISTSYVQRV